MLVFVNLASLVVVWQDSIDTEDMPSIYLLGLNQLLVDVFQFKLYLKREIPAHELAFT